MSNYVNAGKPVVKLLEYNAMITFHNNARKKNIIHTIHCSVNAKLYKVKHTQVPSTNMYDKSSWSCIHIVMMKNMYFVCLVSNSTSTQDRSICANCGRVKPTLLANDGERDTMYN